jgi:hypothetical protein
MDRQCHSQRLQVTVSGSFLGKLGTVRRSKVATDGSHIVRLMVRNKSMGKSTMESTFGVAVLSFLGSIVSIASLFHWSFSTPIGAGFGTKPTNWKKMGRIVWLRLDDRWY